jgi:exosortase/archaeosortase family protein
VKKGKGRTQAQSGNKSGQTGRISIRRFSLVYLAMMGAFFFVISFAPLQRVIDINGVYTKGVVAATTRVLHAVGIPGSSEGSIIRLPSISLDVKFGCNGLEAVMIYSVAVVAFPASWKKKALGVMAGFVVIQVINVLRIAGLAYAGVRFSSIFEYIHIYVAQGVMIAVALGVFLIYLSFAQAVSEETVKTG